MQTFGHESSDEEIDELQAAEKAHAASVNVESQNNLNDSIVSY